jgi:predicted lipoprotein
VALKATVFYFYIMKKINFFLLSIFSVFLIIACSSESDENQNQVADFDRSSILKNYADNIIIPRYNNFKSDLDALKTVVDEFASTPNSENFDKVHNQWFKAYKTWQHVEMFNIGKAEQIMYFNTINTYPVDELRINENINSKRYDLSNANDWSSQGLSGIDYMLHGIEDNKEKIIQKYVDDTNYGDYLKNLLVIMTNNTDDIVQDWPTYKDTFVQSSGNSNSSSLNMITNDFVYYFEKGLRANKIGIPAGVYSGGNTLPSKVEAYYSSKNSFQDISKDLAKEAVIASENLFLGKSSNGVNGPSLKTYLDYIYNSDVNKENLSPIISSNFQKAKEEIDLLDSNFVNQINNDKTKMLNAFDKLQAIVVNMKTDMLSLLSIQVDYIDADGD